MTATLTPTRHSSTGHATVGANQLTDRRTGVLSALSTQERERVEHLMVRRPFRLGRRLTEQDAPGTEFMFLLSGAANVMIDGEVVGEIRAGEFFGEGALLGRQWGTSTSRRATVVLTEDSEIGVCTYREFVTMLREFYSIRKAVFGRATRLGIAPTHSVA